MALPRNLSTISRGNLWRENGLYFEQHKNLRSGVASLHKWCHSTQDGQIWGQKEGREIDRSAFDNALLTRNLERRERETPKKFRRTIPSWTPYNYVIATAAVCPKDRNRNDGEDRGEDCCRESPKRFFLPAGHLFLQNHTENDFYECKVGSGGPNA